MRWNVAGNCTDPFWTTYVGRPRDGSANEPVKYFTFTGGKMTMYLDIGTRCRKCKECLQGRYLQWRYRVREETRLAARSWFGTLTMAPDAQYRMLSLARHQAHTSHVTWESLPADEQFRRVANTSLKEVTKYIKRVRKEAGVPFRYIVVTERHKSGDPHFHMLVHETELRPVRHKTLSSQWHEGFEKWKLVPFEDLKAADYVAKYLAKSALTRIRASLQYGRSDEAGIVGPLLRSIKNNGLQP